MAGRRYCRDPNNHCRSRGYWRKGNDVLQATQSSKSSKKRDSQCFAKSPRSLKALKCVPGKYDSRLFNACICSHSQKCPRRATNIASILVTNEVVTFRFSRSRRTATVNLRFLRWSWGWKGLTPILSLYVTLSSLNLPFLFKSLPNCPLFCSLKKLAGLDMFSDATHTCRGAIGSTLDGGRRHADYPHLQSYQRTSGDEGSCRW